MKKFYILWGRAQVGKTSSLRLFAQTLKNDETVKILTGKIEEECDFDITFFYKGKKISIITAGDYQSIIRNSLEKEDIKNSDLIFCASRTRGETVALFEKEYANDSLNWISKMYVDEKKHRNACNKAVAKFLHEILLEELK